MKHTLSYWRNKARDEGLDWKEVRQVYEDVKAIRTAEREEEWEVLKKCYAMCSPYAKRCGQWFWHRGMELDFPEAFDGGDQAMIPNFDVAADHIALDHPSIVRGDDPAEMLWQFLLNPGYRPAPGPEEIMPEVFDLFLRMTPVCAAEELVPF